MSENILAAIAYTTDDGVEDLHSRQARIKAWDEKMTTAVNARRRDHIMGLMKDFL
jgi:hypothetical protein